MTSFLGFLKSATVEEVVVKQSNGAGGPKKQRNPNPTFLGIRLWKDGSVYPSAALVDKFDLEYRGGAYQIEPATPAQGTPGNDDYVPAKKEKKTFVPNEGTQGNGFDVIDSRSWSQFKADGQMIFVGLIAKSEPKVDLFGTTRFDFATGKPLSSVIDQGSATYGKSTLVPMVEEVYGIKFQREAKEETKESAAVTAQEGVEFVDLAILDEVEGININKQFGRSIMFAPKKVIRGEHAGQEDYVRRENMPLLAMVPQELIGGQVEDAQPEGVESTELPEQEEAGFEATEAVEVI